jgi:hypothetical protein
MSKKKAIAPVPKAIDANSAAQLQREIEVDVPPILEIDALETAEDYSFADGLLSDIARKYDAAEAMRKRAVDPLNAARSEINGWFKPLTDTAQEAMTHLKQIMARYLVATESAQEEAAEAQQLALQTGDAASLNAATAVLTEPPPVARATSRFCWRVERYVKELMLLEDLLPDESKMNRLAREAGDSEQPPVRPGVIFTRDAVVGARR